MINRKHLSGIIDFTKGPLFKNIIIFSVPGFIIAAVQVLFDNIGVMMIGKSGTIYQSAVGAGSAIIAFGLGFLIHIANGGGIAMATAAGAKDEEKQNKIPHTSIAFALVFGSAFKRFVFFSPNRY